MTDDLVVSLGTYSVSKKPVKEDKTTFAIIRSDLKDSTRKVPVSEFVQALTQPNGKAFCNPLNGQGTGKRNVQYISIIGLDFDNKEQDPNLLNRILACEFTKSNALMVYETLSSTKELPRVRVLFMVQGGRIEKQRFSSYIDVLEKIYHEFILDKHSEEPSRLFLPSKNTFEELPYCNFSNRVDFDEARTQQRLQTHTSKVVNAANQRDQDDVHDQECYPIANNVMQQVLIDRDVEKLKVLWQENDVIQGVPKADWSHLDLMDKLQILNLKYLLGLFVRDGEPIQDCLGSSPKDVDTQPSAAIIRSEKDRRWLYYSFRLNRTFNSAQLLMILGGFHQVQTLETFLNRITGFNFNYQESYFEHLDKYEETVKSFEGDAGPYGKVIRLLERHNIGTLLRLLLEYARKYAPKSPIATTGGGISFFLGANKLLNELTDRNVRGLRSSTSVKTKLNLLVELGLIEKVPEKELKLSIVKKLKDNNQTNHGIAIRLPDDLERNVLIGWCRYNGKRHNSSNGINSYNVDSALTNQIASQGTDKYILTLAMKRAYACLLFIGEVKFASSPELGRMLFYFNKGIDHELPTKNQLKKSIELLNKLDTWLSGLETSTATNEFKQTVKKVYGIDLNYHPRTMVYCVPFRGDYQQLEEHELQRKWSIQNCEKGLSDDVLNDVRKFIQEYCENY
ncbi:MAG: hypothetical protein DUD32_03710 [Lactobacillus sp.]|nr:MAG: hypothetical protein DUD32_03710 [Lactobacillus sp.]